MPRTTKPLSDTECRNARPRERDYSLFDGNGLHLLVKKTVPVRGASSSPSQMVRQG